MDIHLEQGTPIAVDWIDATANPGWTTPGEVSWPIMTVTTIGHYWDHNEDAIMLFDSLFDDYEDEDDGVIGGQNTIPICCVRKITILKPSLPTTS